MSSDVHIDRPGARFGRRDLLRTVAEGTAGAVGDEFLRCLVRHVALAFDAKFAFVAEASDPSGAHVEVLSGWFEGDWMDEPFEYDTDGKPCALVVERSVVAFPDALTTRFPEAKPAIEMGLESYLAVCLRSSDGTHLGHMAVMDAGPLTAGEDDVAAMRIFASRAAAELERRQQEAALRRSRARVIEVGDSERRRVGRDLHDGAQQRLAAVANLLTVAQRRVDRGDLPADVLRMASGSSARPRSSCAASRAGCTGRLSERGLRGALESLTTGSEIPITVDVVGGRSARGAGARRLLRRVRVAHQRAPLRGRRRGPRAGRPGRRRLLVEVADDGRGGADPAGGTGLLGLADRVDALGGSLEVDSPPGAGSGSARACRCVGPAEAHAAAASATSAASGVMRGARTAPISRLATASPAAISIPRWKPAASASGCAAPDASASVTREVAALETSASPTAPPIWNALVTIPDAAPACSCGTSATAAIWLLTPTSGSPSAKMTRPGRMSVA